MSRTSKGNKENSSKTDSEATIRPPSSAPNAVVHEPNTDMEVVVDHYETRDELEDWNKFVEFIDAEAKQTTKADIQRMHPKAPDVVYRVGGGEFMWNLLSQLQNCDEVAVSITEEDHAWWELVQHMSLMMRQMPKELAEAFCTSLVEALLERNTNTRQKITYDEVKVILMQTWLEFNEGVISESFQAPTDGYYKAFDSVGKFIKYIQEKMFPNSTVLMVFCSADEKWTNRTVFDQETYQKCKAGEMAVGVLQFWYKKNPA
eukprot:TRINITY_DN76806_c0_g1_i1.p2 TRINITY_DN76806_c0_g1~~TRINITY_DN76806_c0_g1_i1.p2  ORF type:complete len:260 (+),score=15.59 TRINITY_DN76806_c0_g1_i1:47-826(+)